MAHSFTATDTLIAGPASPRCWLVLETSNISAERILAHFLERNRDQQLILSGDSFERFLRSFCDAQLPGHLEVDPDLRTAPV